MVVEIDGCEVRPERRQCLLLLAYLIANRSHPVSRDALVEHLWEKRIDDKGSVINPLLSGLRRMLGEEALSKGRGDVSLFLPDGAWIDVEAAKELTERTLRAVDAERAGEAVELATAALALMDQPLLSEYDLHWVQQWRREQDEDRLAVREALVRARLQLGTSLQLWLAKGEAESLVRAAPYHQPGYELLMRVHDARGDVPEANRVYHELKDLLGRELGLPPARGITELNAELLAPEGAPAAAAPAPRVAPERVPLARALHAVPGERFVGRDEILTALWARWRNAGFHPRVAMLTGEAGMGKTRLAACFSRHVHRDGGTVLYGRCDQVAVSSYQPFHEAIEHYAAARDLARELPHEAEELERRLSSPRRGGAGRPSLPENPHRLFAAVAEVFRHASEAEPLLLVVDDLQWAGAGTRALMLHLVRHLDPARCMFLVTFREPAGSEGAPEPEASVEAWGNRLRREPAEFQRIRLEGLDERETADLIAEWQGSPPAGGFARDLMSRTGGSPFFIGEVLRSLVERDELLPDRRPDLGRPGVPEGAKEVITLRLARHSDAAKRVLAAASVIGPEFSRPLVEAAADVESGVSDALAELVRDKLLIEVPDTEHPTREARYTFAHALLREAQYEDLIDSQKRDIHRRIALELDAQSKTEDREARPLPAKIAHHFYEAGSEEYLEHTVAYLIAAARHAEGGGAFVEAIALYDRALDQLAASDQRQVCRLLIYKGRAMMRASSRKTAARETLARAAAIARDIGASDLLGRAALGFHGRYTAAGQVDRKRIELLEEARSALDRDGDTSRPAQVLRTRVVARLSESYMWADVERARKLSREAVAMAGQLGDRIAFLESLAARHATLLHTRYLDDRLHVTEQRLRIATAAGSDEAMAAALRWHIHDLLESGDLRQAASEHGRLGRLAGRLGQPLYLSYERHWACVFAQVDGRLDEAERLAEEAFALAMQAEAEDADMSLLDKRLSIGRERGDFRHEEWRLEMRAAVERFAVKRRRIPAWYAMGALIDARHGDRAAARAQVDRLLAGDGAAIPRDVFWLYAMALLAETCVLLEQTREPASVVYRLLLPYGDRHVPVGMDSFLGSVWRFVGLAATAAQDWSAAGEAFAKAERRHEQMGSAPLLARTHLNRAGMLLRRGQGADEASRLLDDVEDIAGEFGLEDMRTQAIGLRSTHAHA